MRNLSSGYGQRKPLTHLSVMEESVMSDFDGEYDFSESELQSVNIYYPECYEDEEDEDDECPDGE
jgi:hypothetical protein